MKKFKKSKLKEGLLIYDKKYNEFCEVKNVEIFFVHFTDNTVVHFTDNTVVGVQEFLNSVNKGEYLILNKLFKMLIKD